MIDLNFGVLETADTFADCDISKYNPVTQGRKIWPNKSLVINNRAKKKKANQKKMFQYLSATAIQYTADL